MRSLYDESPDPYQPPVFQEPAPKLPGTWQVAGGELWFRDGARLPLLDVFTGRAGSKLVPCSHLFRARSANSLSVRLLSALGAMAIAIAGKMTGLLRLDDGTLLAALIAIGLLLRFLLARKAASARLHWFVEPAAEGVRQRWRTVATLVSLVGLGLMIAGTIISDSLWTPRLFLAGVVSLVVAVVVQRRMSRLACTGMRDGWFRLAGLRREVLHALSSRPPPLKQAPAMIRRKVFTFYLHRLPLSTLLAVQWWNPVQVLTMVLLKGVRSKKLERDYFEGSEAAALAEAAADPDLIAVLAEIREDPGERGWTLEKLSRTDQPNGEIRTEVALLVSPDRATCLGIALSRMNVVHYSRRTIEIAYRSWLVDGTLVFTTDGLLFHPQPDFCEAVRLRLDRQALQAAHRQRVGDRKIEPFPVGESLRQRFDREEQARHRALERAGIYGAVREEEFSVPLYS